MSALSFQASWIAAGKRKALVLGAALTSAVPISGASASPSPMSTSTSHCRHYQGTHLPSLTISCCAWGSPAGPDPTFPGSYRPPSASLPSAEAALQMPLPSALGWTSICHHRSRPQYTPFPAGLRPGCSLPERLLFPVPVLLTAPQPPVPWPCCQLVLPSCLSFPTSRAQGSVTLWAASPQHPGWGQLCQVQGTPGWPNLLCQDITGSVCPHVTLDMPTGCLCLSSRLTGSSLCPSGSDPSAAARAPTGAPAPAQPPVGFPSSSRCEAEEMTFLLLPRQTRRLPNTQGLASPRLGHRSPSSPCSSPRQPIRGAEQGRNSRGFGGVSANPPRLSQHRQLKGGASTSVPCLGLGAHPGLPVPTGCWAMSGGRFPLLGTQRVPGAGTARPWGGCAEGCPAAAGLAPGRKLARASSRLLQ